MTPPPAGPAPLPADFVVRARHVLTMGPRGHLRDAAVAVVGGRIAAVDTTADVRARFADLPVVGDGGGILIPGLVSAHGHFSEGLVTGIGETHTLWEWFVRVVEPIEGHLTRDMAYVGTLLKAAELACSGVTTVADMFCSAAGTTPVTPGVVDALDAVGLRGDVSFGPADSANPRPVAAVLAEHAALADAARNSRRTTFRVGLATVPSSSDELLDETARLVAETGRLHVHLHEIREEVTASRTTRGTGSIEFAARRGLLDAQVVAAHCVWLDDTDVELLRRHRVAVAHCPVSNMILASGVCQVPRLLRDGLTVALGVDGAASNDSQNMLETMKIAALLQKVHHLQATALTAPTVLRMATIEGARALGLADEVGSLEVGKAADLVYLAEASPSLALVHDPYQAVVYCASPRDVTGVWVAGERVVVDGRLATVDLGPVLPWARELAVELASRAGLDSELRSAAAGPPVEVVPGAAR
ncbi:MULTISPECIES: amidohydrolase family protein [Parafrankia]|uniref:Amidohydrolase n=1 Tax=Parafrankia soli TaxID=2599596 RepID=A0A1S1PDC1_9ACTN|nr:MULTISPECIES: amidohydrolase [Parafrankia]OHV19710.1 amidohydrolase [Parafrankia soli]TCJ36721.1 amidohydrolase [Parafrankia sp. BMG5.11]SQD97419.1 Amidohydrolase [Parafrankia sp. Ea1.12]